MANVSLQRLAPVLGIARGEGTLVALLFALSFCAAGAYVLGYVAASALVLEAYGPSALPYSYIAASGVLVISGLGFARAERHAPLGTLLIAPWCLLTSLGLAIYLGLVGGGPAWLTFALICWTFLCLNVGDLMFWALAGRLLNLEQSKRLFGLTGAGALAARLVLYTLSGLLVGAVGTVNLMAGSLAAMLAALALMVVIARRYPLQPAPPARPPRKPRSARPADPARRRYVAVILGAGFLGELISNLNEFLVFRQASLAFPEPDALAQFIGLYSGGLFLAATLVGALLTRPILGRLGVRGALLIERVGALAAVAAVLVVAALGPPGAVFAAVIVLDTVVNISSESISRPSGQILFQPLPAAERLPAQSLTQSVMEPLALGVCGALLLSFEIFGDLEIVPLTAVMLALVVLSLVMTLTAARGYVQALGRALSRRLVGAGTVTLDTAGMAVVERALGSRRPVEVLSALDMLRSERPERYAAHLPPLLGHPDPAVRREVAARAAALPLPSVTPTLRAMAAAEVDAGVRAAAVAALGALGAPPEQAIGDPAPEVRTAALVALLRHGAPAARAALAALSGSPDPAERALAARVCGAAQDGARLAELLADPAPEVRRAALLAAGPWAPEPFWRAAVAALDDRHCRGAATAALAAGGAAAMPVVAAALASATTEREARLRLAKVCGRIAAPGAADALARLLDAPDDELRDACVAALRRRGYRAGPDGPQIRARLAAEARLVAETQAALADLAPHPAAALLRDGLAAHLERQRRRVLALLSFIVGPAVAQPIEDGLAAGAADRRAYALELVETQVPPDLRAVVAPVLGEGPPRAPGRPLAERLAAIIMGPDESVTPWLRACALYTAGQAEPAALASAVLSARGHSTPVVREQAAWAAGRLAGVGGRPGNTEERAMLTTVERVMVLKGVSIFATTPDAVLADLAALLDEEEVPAGAPIFERGEVGGSLYVIAEGEVRVHDGAVTFNHLGAGSVFGEMAVLEPAPRSASVTAMSDTLLLRLDAEPFYELMDDRPEIARSVIRVIAGRLRDRMADLRAARSGAE